MNALNLNALGVQELNTPETMQTNGGFAWGAFIAGAIAGGLLYDAAKAAYLAALDAYVDAAASGAYNGMPKGR
jgi:thiol:disulfide interchange protein